VPRLGADRVTVDLTLIAMAAGFGSFGAVASLAEVAHYFGHSASATTFAGIVGLSGTTLGLGLGALRLASLAAMPLAALADRFGRRAIVQLVAVAGLLLTALAAGSTSYWAFVLFFALARPLLTATTTLVQVVCVELSNERVRVVRLAWVAAGAGVGAGISAILHGLLPGGDAFRILFATAAIPALAVRPLMRSVPEPVAHLSAGTPLTAHLGAIPRRFWYRLLVVGAVTVLLGLITGPANGFAFVYAESVLNISRHQVALVVFLSAATGLAGLVVGRFMADRFGRRVTIAAGSCATAATSLLAYSGGRSSFIAGYMSGIFAAALLAPALSAMANELFPHAVRATAAGWVVVAGVLGAILGLVIFGYVGDVAHTVVATTALRVPAVVTFLPGLPLLVLLWTVPETRDVTID
jgi:MFS family permease